MNLKLSDFRILDEVARNSIHQQALAILYKQGFLVHSKAVRQRLAKAGARVDETREVVTLPAELIAEAVAACPEGFTLYDLDGRPIRYTAGTILNTVSTYVEAVKWLDYGATSCRPSRLEDLKKALILADAIPLVAQTGIVVWPGDLPVERQFPAGLCAVLTTTRKSLVFGLQNLDHARLLLDALRVAAPECDLRRKPCCMFVSSPTSPFVFDRDSGDALIFALEHGFVPVLAPCPMAGGTSQFSIIGTVLQQVAENLFMVTARHAINPKSPLLWGGAGAPMDMKAGDVAYGGVERSLMMLANIDMAVHFGVPCHSPSASVDSCLLDTQLGAEKTWTYLTRAFSRAATGMGIGAIGNGKAVSAEGMLIDADIIRSIERLRAGIETDHLERAAQEILEAGHGGNFMMSETTLDLLREGREYFYPATFNRKGTDAATALERAHAEVERITSEWKRPVPERRCEELERMLGASA